MMSELLQAADGDVELAQAFKVDSNCVINLA